MSYQTFIMRLRIIIPRVPPSLNRVPRHWAAKRDMRDLWIQEVRGALPETYLKPIVRMRVIITLHNARQYDRDNAYGSVKPILDAIKNLNLIVDDSPEYCDLQVRQEKSTRKEARTVIELEPA